MVLWIIAVAATVVVVGSLSNSFRLTRFAGVFDLDRPLF